ncbi:MAG: sigma-54-dependent Fis family transcriptional regulator [Deltaproteobacteria bacterium]|nr:sigma-54-dependent Fis family transcriptional regulator [Deltaproteobacteria bacterium]
MNKTVLEKTDRILIIGETEDETRRLADVLASGYNISAARNVLEAANRLKKDAFNVILFDLGDDSNDPETILQTLQQHAPLTPVIFTGPMPDAELIVRVIKAGASDFITRPVVDEKIRLAVHQAIENRSLKNEIDYLRRQQDVEYSQDRIISVSPVMEEIMATIRRVARSDANILMTGETGTGKSFISGHIHFNSPRSTRPFVKINCANIPDTLLESELFGHEKGAFTGADKTRAGRFEQADRGTLFLDEFCELNFDLQAKLLRVLEEKTYERLGGNKTIQADTRIIAATNRDIEAQVGEGKFREDLYYRINVLRIHMPPLRERIECIEPLAYYLLDRLSRAEKKQVDTLSPEVLVLFKTYHWPGNIRELSNTIERAIFLTDGPTIEPVHISLPKISEPQGPAAAPPAMTLRLSDQEEKELIFRALEKNLWIQKDAAKELGLTPRALNYRIKKHGITHSRWRKNK